MSVSVQIHGEEQMQKALKGFADDAFKMKVLMATYRKAGKPFIKAARDKAPVADKQVRAYDGKIIKPQTLKKSIGQWPFRRAKNVLFMGAKFGRRSMKYDGWYYRFLEYGTVHQAAQPFLRPAWDATVGTISDTIKKDFTAVLEKFKRKYGYA
jgi:HK97 gp10 family phage protein